MNWIRWIGEAIGMFLLPVIFSAGVFFIIHSIAHDGIGPDDGANLIGFAYAFPAAILSAIVFWSWEIVRIFKRIRSKRA